MKNFLTLLLSLVLLYGCSTSSDGNGDSTTTLVPLAPSNLTGVVASTTQINLAWTDNSTNETGFKIERKTGTGTYAVVGTTSTNLNTFNDTNLLPGTTYNYRVYSYNSGGNSLNYSNEFTLTTSNTVAIDIDGNIYQLVTLCNQTWTKSNLNVTHYRNGDVIPQANNISELNVSVGAWCYYTYENSNGTIYGKLYNWYAVTDPRGLAPVGFHIPSVIEASSLGTNCLGGMSVAGGKMKQTGNINWISPNTGATNESELNCLPGGGCFRSPFQDYSFGGKNSQGYWWTSTGAGINSYSFYLEYNSSELKNKTYPKNCFLSVRCIKD